MSDQFSRFVCSKCGECGFDSWNKALHDGIDHDGDYPNPFIIGDNCQRCWWPAVIAYYGPGERPRIIFGSDPDGYGYEPDAMLRIENNEGLLADFGPQRDSDWSRGCVNAKAQLQ